MAAVSGIAEEAVYSEGVFVGYRRYDEHGIEPLFPFGHGLSYTPFEYERFRARAGGTAACASGSACGTPVRGRGPGRAGLSRLPDPNPGVEQPPKALKAFAKVRLEPRRRTRLRFELDTRALSYWDVGSNGWVVAPGCYG